jgi:hypothetical protein
MRVNAKPITDPAAIYCPCCSTPLYEVGAHHSRVSDGGYLITDGDSMSGVWHGLPEDDRAKGWIADFQVGKCRACHEGYYFVAMSFVQSPGDDQVMEYLLGDIPAGPETNFHCTIEEGTLDVPEPWIMQQHASPVGLIQRHLLGPWKIDHLLPQPEDQDDEDAWVAYEADFERSAQEEDPLWSGAGTRRALTLWRPLHDLNAHMSATR